ncbi:hypothetical protein GA0116948_11545 [Chitinophaga costaii]|uniref:Transmembrane protein n=1 Tax=Chitinophaga costaii TaxID=1335309 RepID=A0A1C4FKY7_9BACT|nr:hypothetical protein [Chitinophaga costaii]PUZ29974.1 hypothetical protein DCM91_00375 [Chitinophaga costaii]SCC56679.1 hypothetical protein GA0116948_11545 [Chitinophaga costaii]
MGSFYNLDYIIEINEKRLEQYSNAYQKQTDKFTNILVLYSTFTIFVIPIAQTLFFEEAKCYWLEHVLFYGFSLLFLVSAFNTIRLLIPVEVAYQREPRRYYETYRLNYEDGIRTPTEVDILVKASYIEELELAVRTNFYIMERKKLFYYRALIFALLACGPYLLCIGFQLSMKTEKIQKVDIVNFSNLVENKLMAKEIKQTSQSISPTGNKTRLPGVDSSQVIPSSPIFFKESLFFDTTTAHKLKKKSIKK